MTGTMPTYISASKPMSKPTPYAKQKLKASEEPGAFETNPQVQKPAHCSHYFLVLAAKLLASQLLFLFFERTQPREF